MLADYVITRANRGENRVFCPSCGPQRRNKSDTPLSLRDEGDRVVYHCHHCGVSGASRREETKRKPEMQTSVVPIKKIERGDLTMDALMWLEERGISSAVAEAAGITSGKAFFRKLNKEADAVGFVYRHKDNDYAVKWRCIEDKAFTQTGSAQTLYLADKCKVGEPVIITEGECFPGDAEIMTPGGWVRFDSYIGGPVAQWDHGTISFVEPLARVQKPFTGNLVELSVRGYHSLTTPGHRIPRIKKRDGSLQFVQADFIPSNIDSIPRVGVLNGPGIPLTDEQIAFAIAVSADSKVDIRKNTGWKKAEEDRYLHFGFKKERKIDRILELVSDLGLSPLVTSFIDQKDVGLSKTYLSMPCPDWVPGRLLPFEWIALATQRQREFQGRFFPGRIHKNHLRSTIIIKGQFRPLINTKHQRHFAGHEVQHPDFRHAGGAEQGQHLADDKNENPEDRQNNAQSAGFDSHGHEAVKTQSRRRDLKSFWNHRGRRRHDGGGVENDFPVCKAIH